MAEYRLLYADLIDGTILGELPIVSLSFDIVLDGPGRMSATVPLDSTATPDTLAVAKTSMFLERDGVILWGGILWTASAVVAAGTLALDCAGFHSYFEHRYIRSTQNYVNVEQLTIARGFLTAAQSVPSGDIGVEYDMSVSGITRNRSYLGFERKQVAESFEQLAAVDNGFDWHYTWTRDGDVIVPTIEFQYPATGRVTDLVFELGTNCAVLSYSEDGTTIATSVDAIGAGEGADRLIRIVVNAPLLTAGYPLLEDVISHTDVTSVVTLEEHARRRLTRGAGPTKNVRIGTFVDVEPRLGEYQVGDRVTVRAFDGWLVIDGRFRIVQISLALEDGGENVTLDLVDVAVFDAV